MLSSERAMIPQAHNQPVCLIPPPSILRYLSASFIKSQDPAVANPPELLSLWKEKS